MIIRLSVTKIVQDSQDLGSTDEHMASRLFFDVAVDGQQRASGAYVDLKQTIGNTWTTGDLEVSPPRGYRGPFDHQQFRTHAERIYRAAVNRLYQGAGTVRMRNNVFTLNESVELETKGHTGGPW